MTAPNPIPVILEQRFAKFKEDIEWKRLKGNVDYEGEDVLKYIDAARTEAYRRGQLDAAQEIEQATTPTAELVSRFVTQTVKDALHAASRAAFERAIEIVKQREWFVDTVQALESEMRK